MGKSLTLMRANVIWTSIEEDISQSVQPGKMERLLPPVDALLVVIPSSTTRDTDAQDSSVPRRGRVVLRHQLCLHPDAVPDDKLPDLASPTSLILPKAVIRTAPSRHAYTSLHSRSLVRAQALSLPKTFPRLSQCHLTFLLHASL